MTTLLTPISEQNVGTLAGFDEDVEPDTEWKEALRARIEKELQSMADKVRQERDAQLRGAPEGSPQYETVMRTYQASMDRVRRIAQDQFNQELKIARFERSLALGKEVEGEEFEAFRRQQQAIWEAIKKGGAERPQGRRDSNVASSSNQENGEPVAVPPRAGGDAEVRDSPGTPYRPREAEAREGPNVPYRDPRPLARTPLGSESRPRDRTQSGGSDQFAGTPGSYGTRPARSRGNSSVFGADFDPTATSSSPYDQGSIGRQGLSSLSRTRPQDIWMPSPPPPTSQSSTSRAFAHAAASSASPVSPNIPANENGRTLSRAGSVRSNERPSPVADFEPGSAPHRDRFPLGTVEERTSTRKGKEPDRSDHQRQPSFTQQTAVHEIYARRPDSRMTMPITPSRPTLASSEDQYFPQISPINPRYRQDPDESEGIPIRSSRRSVTSDQGSPENVRYGPPSSVSARPIPSKRSYNGDFDAWPSQQPPTSRPYYGPQSPPPMPVPSSSRPIPRPANGDDEVRRHSPSGAWYGSQSPPNALPFAGYDIPTSSSPRRRFSGSPAGSVSGRRNSNGSRSVRSRSSRQEFWGPSDVPQRPVPIEEQSVASGSDSEDDYGMDLDELWHTRERQELRERQALTWKLEARRLEEEARRKEEEAARKEAEARRKEEEARRQAEEARKKEEEVWQKALEVQQKAEALARREAELLVREAEARAQEEKRKREEAEARLQEEIRRRQEAEERRAREEAERREREKEERERRDREEKERRERDERERKDREERERKERERREREERERREWEEKARQERERREREERERRIRERHEMEERLKRQREDEARLAQEKREWEEARKREEEARAAAQAQAILEAERLRREAEEEEAAEAEAEAEAEAQRQEARRREEERQREERLRQEEARKKEEGTQRKTKAQKREEARQREIEQREADAKRQREEEETRRARELEIQEARRQEEEAESKRRREEEEAQRRREEEERRVRDLELRREEDARREREEAEAKRRHEEEAQRRREAERAAADRASAERAAREKAAAEEAQRRLEATTKQREEEARARVPQVVQPLDGDDDDFLGDLQDPVFLREQQAAFEALQRTAAAKKRAEEEARRVAQFKKDQADAYKDEQNRLREDEARRRVEEVMRRKEAMRAKQEEAVLEEVLRRSAKEHQEQERRLREDRRRQDSVGSGSDTNRDRPGVFYAASSASAPRPIPTSASAFRPTPSAPGDRSSTASSSSFSSSASFFSASSGWSASTGTSRASTTPTASAAPTPKPATPSVAPGAKTGWKSSPSPATPSPTTASSTRSSGAGYQTAYGSGTSYAQSAPSTARPGTSFTSSSPMDEHEWARRQEEHARRQFEQFQREQEAQQRRAEQKAIRQLSKEDVIKLFEEHERRWARLASLDVLSWHSFPWPMLKQPTDPEQLTYIEIQAYVLSPHHPGDKTSKEQIKDYLRKWHPDRFETKVLPKVREDDREKVKEGAGTVARHLNKLLSSLSSSAENGLFG